jgi:hypothetical protein
MTDSGYPEWFDERYKQFIRDIYGNVCFECGRINYPSPISKRVRNLAVHHYDYNKDSRNCVPLCGTCHYDAGCIYTDWENHYKEKVLVYWKEQFAELPGIIV